MGGWMDVMLSSITHTSCLPYETQFVCGCKSTHKLGDLREKVARLVKAPLVKLIHPRLFKLNFALFGKPNKQKQILLCRV
jgi:hypothetical protein